uniref:Uncharacterized protein n=1 Tax=Romanomermis culicivorax TaxID=13658 RepID=A0A915KTW4_ROMCU
MKEREKKRHHWPPPTNNSGFRWFLPALEQEFLWGSAIRISPSGQAPGDREKTETKMNYMMSSIFTQKPNSEEKALGYLSFRRHQLPIVAESVGISLDAEIPCDGLQHNPATARGALPFDEPAFLEPCFLTLCPS